jgi:hypothetical protein
MKRLLILLFMLTVPLFAHHGTGVSYDESKTLVLKGTVTDFFWSNPHAHILFDVKDQNGTVTNWAAEGSSPANWARQGWTKNTLKKGDVITITLHPSKAGTPVGVVVKVVLPD